MEHEDFKAVFNIIRLTTNLRCETARLTWAQRLISINPPSLFKQKIDLIEIKLPGKFRLAFVQEYLARWEHMGKRSCQKSKIGTDGSWMIS